ncbi:MAG: allophanate hydrolase [bacterium]
MMTIASIRRDLQSGALTVEALIENVYRAITARGQDGVWIFLRPKEEVLREALGMDPSLPLFGVPFAVKDNIDVAGIPTTAACPAFSFTPIESAFVVQKLRDAGALVIGKTNMDQFATGLVGTRTPHGACRSVFHSDYISGGSSSGSAVAVAAGLVAFSLGTDTAGSGRVPAAFNNIVGLKPTRGLLSLRGVLPACASLDCVSLFANTVEDAETVFDVAAVPDPCDPWSRESAGLPARRATVRLGVPRQCEFFGDTDCEKLFEAAVENFRAQGCEIVAVDLEPFLETARLLYGGPWVAERDHAVGEFIRQHPDEVDPVVRGIITDGPRKTAVEAFDGFYKLQRLRAAIAPVWKTIDALLVPTAPTIYRVEEVLANPVELNSRLGTYTNFVNLLDLSALAVPAGFRSDGLPFGVTLIGPAFEDRLLAAIACNQPTARGMISVAVVGAHLSGQPLNHQLTSRGAILQRTTTTSAAYRLHALPTEPPKPGLVRLSTGGALIEVEIWDLPLAAFGSFVALVPPPLAIGNLELADGSWVKGFVCEPAMLETSPDISHFGSWRAYLRSLTA